MSVNFLEEEKRAEKERHRILPKIKFGQIMLDHAVSSLHGERACNIDVVIFGKESRKEEIDPSFDGCCKTSNACLCSTRRSDH